MTIVYQQADGSILQVSPPVGSILIDIDFSDLSNEQFINLIETLVHNRARRSVKLIPVYSDGEKWYKDEQNIIEEGRGLPSESSPNEVVT